MTAAVDAGNVCAGELIPMMVPWGTVVAIAYRCIS